MTQRSSLRVVASVLRRSPSKAAPPPTCVPVASVLEDSQQLIGSFWLEIYYLHM